MPSDAELIAQARERQQRRSHEARTDLRYWQCNKNSSHQIWPTTMEAEMRSMKDDACHVEGCDGILMAARDSSFSLERYENILVEELIYLIRADERQKTLLRIKQLQDDSQPRKSSEK